MIMTDQEIISIVQARIDGKQIQARPHYRKNEDWLHPLPNFIWDFANCDYRIKPEPLELWVNEYPHSFGAYPTRAIADDRSGDGRLRCIHMVEVVE